MKLFFKVSKNPAAKAGTNAKKPGNGDFSVMKKAQLKKTILQQNAKNVFFLLE
jgi:hypothetical protein